MEQAQFTTQGTRLSEKAPWETYGAEMDSKMSSDLAQAVAEYAEKRYEEDSSSNEAKEELHRQREINEEISKEYQWLKPEEYADIEQRIGRVMHSSEFISTLRKSGISCWYSDHPQPKKITLLVSRNYGMQPLEVACWAQLGFMPELSIMKFDDHGVPLDERRRGWRTCLLQIILKGILSEERAIRIFGHPRQTDAFARYNRTLQNFRNAGNSLALEK